MAPVSDDDESGEHDLGDDDCELEAVEREAGATGGGARVGPQDTLPTTRHRGSLGTAALLTEAVRTPSHRRSRHVDLRNAEGGTPLHSAANNGGAAIGRLLVEG